jgi:predicted aspartyl protease
MMEPMTSKLPPDQRQGLDADFLANEQDYLRMRDGLLASHYGQWVAVHNGRVITAGDDLMAVTDAADATGGHPFIARIGEEETPFRVRRAEFNYDRSYQPFPIPRVTVTFWNHAETRSQTHSDVIPDTGADVSILPKADCAALDLFHSPYQTITSHGVIGSGVTALLYRGKAEIDGQRLRAYIQPIEGGRERIIGRDVLNRHRVTFDGPLRRVVFGS